MVERTILKLMCLAVIAGILFLTFMSGMLYGENQARVRYRVMQEETRNSYEILLDLIMQRQRQQPENQL